MKLVKNLSIYLAADVINKAIPFLLLPVLTYYLSPADYGLLALYGVVVLFETPLVQLALTAFITKEFFILEKEKLSGIIFSILALAVLTSIVLGGFNLILFFITKNFFDFPFYIYIIIPVVVFFRFIGAINLLILRNEKKAIQFGIYQIIFTLTDILLVLFFIIKLQWNWEGRVLAGFFAAILFGFVHMYSLTVNNWIRPKWEFQVLQRALRITLPIIPSVLLINVINLSDRFFVKSMIGNTALGLYSIGYTLGMIIFFIHSAANNSLIPWIHEKLSDKENLLSNQIEIIKFSKIYFLALTVLAVFIIIGSLVLMKMGFLSKEYYSAQVYIPWITVSYLFFCIAAFFNNFLLHVGKTGYNLVISAVSASINILLNYWLINEFGAIGAAYATFVSTLIIFVGIIFFAQKIYPLPWLSNPTR